MMVNRCCLLVLVLFSLVTSDALAARRSCYAEKPSYAEDAKIIFKSSAYVDGSVTFAFKPKRSGRPLEVEVEIKEGWSAEKVALEARAAFDTKIGLDYKVKIEERRKVQIKNARGPAFCLMLKELDIEGLSVRVEY